MTIAGTSADHPRTTLLALAERVEALTGPCRETDARIYHLAGASENMKVMMSIALATPADEADSTFYERQSDKLDVPNYTSSLDAAMTLVPDVCLAMVKHLWDGPKRCGYAFVSQYTSDAEECDGKRWVTDFQGCAETQPLALVAAALRACASVDRISPIGGAA